MISDHGTISGADAINDIRHFNRFYTQQLGLLNEGLLRSQFSLSEARVLYELANRKELTATELGQELGLDAGYLSRILKKFENQGLILRRTSSVDARQSIVNLSDAGTAAFEPLDRASRDQIAAMLAPLQEDDTRDLVCAMHTIEQLLGERTTSLTPYLLRTHQVGDLGWIVHRQGVLYNREYGWDETFEALVAEICSIFIQNYDPHRECSWIAEREGAVVGSVLLVRESETVGKLRLLYVEPSARRLGIGRRLVAECIRRARQVGYETLTLWTNDVLVSARQIYEAAGFKLVSENPHHSFGKDLVGQNWVLAL